MMNVLYSIAQQSGPHKIIISGFLLVSLCALLLRSINNARVRLAFIQAQGCQPSRRSYPGYRLLFGCDFVFENARNILHRNFADGVRDRFTRYGGTYTSRILHKRIVNTIDPENYEAFMKTYSDDYGVLPTREKVVKATLGSGIFSASGHEWTRARALVRQGMTKMTYDFDVYKECADEMIQRVRQREGAPFDFCEIGYDYTFELTANLFFGGRTEADGALSAPSAPPPPPPPPPPHQNISSSHTPLQQFAKDFRALGLMGRKLTLMIGQIPHLAEIVYGNDYRRSKCGVDNFADQRIAQSLDLQSHQQLKKCASEPRDLRSSQTYRSLIHALATGTTDRLRIRHELLNLLLAAHDTNGIALTELIYFLARAPAVWSKLRTEITEKLCGVLPQSIADLKRLTYLRYVIQESTRLRPTLSVHARKALRDTVLPRGGGSDGCSPLFVPKASYVLYSNYALHRNVQVFSTDINTDGDDDDRVRTVDVDAFRPERWESISPERFEFLPFGAGPRACPGEKLGWSVLAYAVVRLVMEFEGVRERDDKPWEEATTFSFFNRHGVWVEFLHRDDDHDKEDFTGQESS